MQPVVILGANGQLGSDLCRSFEDHGAVVALTHNDIELRNHSQVDEVLSTLKPRAVINTAAFHKVELCEEDPEQAFAVNCHAVRNLALACDRLDVRLVHLSTDYVFGGDRQTPYPEDAPPAPLNVYGVSKAAGEYFVRSHCRRHLVVRVSGLFGLAGSSGKGGNFVETMLRLGRERGTVSVVTDQVLSPTYTHDLAKKIFELTSAEAQGVFHVTNSDSCSWFGFARAIFEFSGMAVDIQPASSGDMGSPVRRPAYSVLENRRLRDERRGVLRPWRDALAAYLDARVSRPQPAWSMAQ